MGNSLFDSAQSSIDISLVDLVLGLLVAVLLGLVIVFTYRWAHRGLHYERSFLITLMMMPPIVGVVMMLIGSNLVLSLGMVGALSIIRFRTVIKDSRDMVFLFFAIAVGLGCGTYNFAVTVVATVFLSTMLLILHLCQFGTAMHSDYALVVAGRGSLPNDAVRATIKQHVDFVTVRSVQVDGDAWEMVFEVRFFRTEPPSETNLMEELKGAHGIERVSILAPQLSLPL